MFLRAWRFATILFAALSMGVALAQIFWIWVAPVNAAMQPLSPDTLPPDWTQLRSQWEYAHAARALLQLGALAALVCSLLAEIPGDR